MCQFLKCINVVDAGVDCDSDFDSCDNEPCGNDRNCTDLSPTQEVLQNRSYTCSKCPPGYSDTNGKCIGNILLCTVDNKYTLGEIKNGTFRHW